MLICALTESQSIPEVSMMPMYLSYTGATTRMRSLMLKYSNQPSSFLSAWCGFYREMSLLGVDVKPAGLNVSDGWSPLVALGTPTIMGLK